MTDFSVSLGGLFVSTECELARNNTLSPILQAGFFSDGYLQAPTRRGASVQASDHAAFVYRTCASNRRHLRKTD